MGSEPRPIPGADSCPVCGSLQLQEIRCKVVCLNCRTIVQSCADLQGA